MARIQSRDEYQEIVEQLAEENTEGIENGAAKDVAMGVIASRETFEGKPVVALSPSVWGAKPEALDEALLPYEVLMFSEAIVDLREHKRSEAWAVTALTADLETAVDEGKQL